MERTNLRPSISEQAKQKVAEALNAIPDGKRGATIFIADGDSARIHLAAKLNGEWKVALTGSRKWTGALSGEITVVGAW